MTMHRCPTIALIPAAMLSILLSGGPALSGPSDAGTACRQFVPSAGVTIAVDCAQPVAAVVVKTSAPVPVSTCRRFVPSAQMSIEEPCPEPVAETAAPAISSQPKPPSGAPAATAPAEPSKAPQPVQVKPAAQAPSAASGKTVALMDTDRAPPGGCAGIIERAQLGLETHHDLKTLKSGCPRGG